MQTPAIARLQTAEAHLRPRRDEIVASLARELQKLCGNFDTDQVRHSGFASRRTAAVAKEARQWRKAARLKRSAQNVFLFRYRVTHDRPVCIARACSPYREFDATN